ncbi:cytosine permease [Streptomyces sp. NBC_01020]|uniref:purine-cytosine permease family protein n=1 Tax=Streptomyces sp. NBC_01020 TaxID=2903722 RepID=UPI003868090F|nr:cytosine permease [Streptomyces sp. NBC_01020]
MSGTSEPRSGTSEPHHDSAKTIESATIQPIPDSERHGTNRDLFTIWFGSNIMVLSIVTGGLSTTLFGQPLWTAVLGVVAGNLIGAVFMALHSAQGPTLGIPQMVQTRGQFGSYGSVLIILVVIVMYIGWFVANLVFGGQSLATITPISTKGGITIIAVASLIATIYGYRLIHAYTRIMTYLSGAMLALAFVWVLFVHPLPHDFFGTGGATLAGFMGTVSAAAVWQIAYAPYVSDYSRYMPAGTGAKPAFWMSYWGSTIGSILPMLLGASVGLALPGADVIAGLTKLTGVFAVPIVVVFTVGIAATNAMNLYCSTLSTITVAQTFAPRWSARARERAVVAAVLCGIALAIALLGEKGFLASYNNFIVLLLSALVPWTAVNLVDYYLVRHGDYVVEDFFKADGGRYGRINWPAVLCYLVGAAVQVPFLVTTIYTGPLGAKLGGVDISWCVGLVVASPVYYLVMKRYQARKTAVEDPPAFDTDVELAALD